MNRRGKNKTEKRENWEGGVGLNGKCPEDGTR